MRRISRLAASAILILAVFYIHSGFAQSRDENIMSEGQPPPGGNEAVVDINGDWYKGNKFAQLVIIEFCDYQSPFCARHVHETLPEIEKEYINTGKIRYILLDFPSSSHEQSFKTAEAVNCAIDKNKVWEMRTRLYTNQNALSREDLLKHAEVIGLEKTEFKECLDSGKFTQKIRKDIAEGQKTGITETPAFLLGFTAESEGKVKVVKTIKGAQPYSVFKGDIDSLLASAPEWGAAKGRTFYVRQTVGDDANDGLSPQTAWRHISKLSKVMRGGDTAYVGPGIYREAVSVLNSGTADKRLRFIADNTGQRTGDPPGTVMITGAEPVDESIFEPHSKPGVYMAKFPSYSFWGVVEMDSDQYRYNKITQTKEYLVDKMPPIDIVAKFPSSYFYDDKAKVLYIHTSDEKHPSTHEIEVIKYLNGFYMEEKHYVTIMGFTFRHFGDAGINFFKGSSHGIAVNNMAYGGRQGVRVYTATNILVYGNTLFRNENCGVYFAARSAGGEAIGNILYENIKGIRIGSESVFALAIDNIIFDNIERGISIEEANSALLRHNRLVNNKQSQMLILKSKYDSEDNCFENGAPGQFIADFYPFPPSDQFKTLIDYQNVWKQDQHSKEGSCGPLPEKIDVHRLHEETMGYVERSRRILNKSSTDAEREIKR